MTAIAGAGHSGCDFGESVYRRVRGSVIDRGRRGDSAVLSVEFGAGAIHRTDTSGGEPSSLQIRATAMAPKISARARTNACKLRGLVAPPGLEPGTCRLSVGTLAGRLIRPLLYRLSYGAI